CAKARETVNNVGMGQHRVGESLFWRDRLAPVASRPPPTKETRGVTSSRSTAQRIQLSCGPFLARKPLYDLPQQVFLCFDRPPGPGHLEQRHQGIKLSTSFPHSTFPAKLNAQGLFLFLRCLSQECKSEKFKFTPFFTLEKAFELEPVL